MLTELHPPAVSRRMPVLWRATLFALIGLLLYLCLYAGSEALVYHYGQRNRFFMVRTAPLQQYDYVIVGASHAVPFDFEDMNRVLEQASGTHIINLSVEGGGILPAVLMVDYFLTSHTTHNVVYFLDSFAFNSPEWNETRLADANMFLRAPLDPALVTTLWCHPWARENMLDYVTGFSKINNPNRFKADVSDAERESFHKIYRPIAYLDRQRIQYLYPSRPDPSTVERYHDAFVAFARSLRTRGIRLIVIRPPLPQRIIRLIPSEAEFNAEILNLAQELDFPVYDFSNSMTKDEWFYDSDHLNRSGVELFAKQYLVQLLVQYR